MGINFRLLLLGIIAKRKFSQTGILFDRGLASCQKYLLSLIPYTCSSSLYLVFHPSLDTQWPSRRDHEVCALRRCSVCSLDVEVYRPRACAMSFVLDQSLSTFLSHWEGYIDRLYYFWTVQLLLVVGHPMDTFHWQPFQIDWIFYFYSALLLISAKVVNIIHFQY